MSIDSYTTEQTDLAWLKESPIFAQALPSAVCDLADYGIIALDAHYHAVLWNRWMVATSGISREEALGHRLQRLFPGPLPHRLLDAIDAALKENMASVVSYALHDAILPLYLSSDDRNRDQRIPQRIRVTPHSPAAGVRCCVLEILDFSTAVAREAKLLELSEHNDQLHQSIAHAETLRSGESTGLATTCAEDSGNNLEPSSNRVERRQLETRLALEKNRIEIALACVADGVVMTDEHGHIEFLNAVAARHLGLERSQAIGVPTTYLLTVVDEDSDDSLRNPILACLRTNLPSASAVTGKLLRPDGSGLFIDYSVTPIHDTGGELKGAVMVFRDRTQQRLLAQQLNYQATHDSITGLLNRAEFERRLGLMLAHGRGQDAYHALLYLDLDQFKLVNDTCGHAAGDQLLRQVSELFRGKIRQSDTIARLGGDEFGILLGECPAETALKIADNLRKAAADFRFAWEERWLRTAVSIGLVPFRASELDSKAVLSAADSACYLAKEQGRNRVQVYRPGQGEIEQRRDEMQWATRIHQALAENRFCLYYQPIIPLGPLSDSVPRGELLVRLIDENGKTLPPGAFISAAERFNQMSAIDRWVVSSALEQIAQAARNGIVLSCSINLSGQSLGSADFADFVLSEIDASAAEPSLICFEVTETAAISDLSAALAFIRKLKDHGCRFALDDFGSGLSSFAYLKSLPIDYLKIDGQFVEHIVKDPVDHAMVEAIHRMAQLMGLRTIAERIEDKETLNTLMALGIDYGQGYGIARPEPFDLHLQRNHSNPTPLTPIAGTMPTSQASDKPTVI